MKAGTLHPFRKRSLWNCLSRDGFSFGVCAATKQRELRDACIDTRRVKMLYIYFGDREDEVYNPPMYFLNQYEDAWITSELGMAMIKDVE